MVRLILLALGAVFLLDNPVHAQNKMPADIQAVLDKAEQLELFVLDPVPPKEKLKDSFHGWKILGKTPVKNAETRKKVIAAFKKGVADNGGQAAFCFNPRHGLRATHDGKTFDLVICFECFQVQAYSGEKIASNFLITDSPQPVFNAVLKEAKVRLREK